ncbi:hypothetical protein KBB76_01970 [Candidatus Saccharibacteria bacterium]|jgi:hypothetical protein|nr:hypothetical protein [Candidatus Saccharibacteria bacterium]HOR23554.1 hypothetical protein [Candidatus Saccharibacteria bacterium]
MKSEVKASDKQIEGLIEEAASLYSDFYIDGSNNKVPEGSQEPTEQIKSEKVQDATGSSRPLGKKAVGLSMQLPSGEIPNVKLLE